MPPGVMYYSKGSGSDGVNTVYFVDTPERRARTAQGCRLQA